MRRVFQVAEFMSGKDKVNSNILYRWVPETDEFVSHNKSLAFFDELSRHTGMSEEEIVKEIEKKKKIFEWILKNKLNDLNSIGKIMNLYYMNNEKLQEIIRNNAVSEIKKPIENKGGF